MAVVYSGVRDDFTLLCVPFWIDSMRQETAERTIVADHQIAEVEAIAIAGEDADVLVLINVAVGKGDVFEAIIEAQAGRIVGVA